MTHTSCDRCGADLATERERSILTIALTPVAVGRDPDCDPVRATAELLDELESGEHPALAPPYRAEYELCRTCRARYLADPFGRAAGRNLRFSKN